MNKEQELLKLRTSFFIFLGGVFANSVANQILLLKSGHHGLERLSIDFFSKFIFLIFCIFFFNVLIYSVLSLLRKKEDITFMELPLCFFSNSLYFLFFSPISFIIYFLPDIFIYVTWSFITFILVGKYFHQISKKLITLLQFKLFFSFIFVKFPISVMWVLFSLLMCRSI